MSIANLARGLERIKTDLDVECTCHLHHGPNCPKRIAEAALAEHGKDPGPDDMGFSVRKLAENAELVEAVAAALSGQSAERWESFGMPQPDELQMKDLLRRDAHAALLAIDNFKRGAK